MRDDCTLQSKQPWMHASYGLVKTRLICYVGKMRMFTRIGICIIPVVTSAHPHYTPGLATLMEWKCLEMALTKPVGLCESVSYV